MDRDNLKAIYEQYMLDFYHINKRFTFEDFGEFATTLLNYQVNSQLLDRKDKQEAAYYLTTLYNKGMGNRITEEDMQTISRVIAHDFSLNLELLQKILA